MSKLRPEKIILWARWVLVAPTAVLGFFISYFSAVIVFEGLNNWCPGGEVSSGMCSGPFLNWYFWGTVMGGALSAPFLVVTLGSLMAPSRRVVVAWTIYALGLCVAFRMIPRMFFMFIPVAVLGAGAAWLIQRRERLKLQRGTA